MLLSLAWRNLARNLRRSILTGAAVAFGVVLIVWMRGLQDGSYVQMIDQAVQTRLGHLQVLPEGYLERPEARLFVSDADQAAERLRAVEGVRAVSQRVLAEGMVARDNESSQVDVVGVRPEDEAASTIVDDRVLEGEAAEAWCRRELAEALEVMGGDEELFDRWCSVASSGAFFPNDDDRAAVIGAGVAKQLLVSVGDEVTVQVVRAVEGGGEEAGSLSQRRLEVVGLVRTGNPEVDDRVIFAPMDTVAEMLGTGGPTELVVMLDDIRRLEVAREEARAALSNVGGIEVHTWAERNPALKSLIEVDSESGNVMYVILFLLVALGVINATLMSVLERVKEFGVMLALGTRPRTIFNLVMTEVGLLGLVSIAVGSLLGGVLEAFGRIHGWPLEWFGYENIEGSSMSGVVYESIYYSGLTPANGAIILLGVYAMFLLAGLFPAWKASRLQPVDAMRTK